MGGYTTLIEYDSIYYGVPETHCSFACNNEGTACPITEQLYILLMKSLVVNLKGPL